MGRRLLRLVGVGWSQRLGESDCLLKTQVRAKTYVDVYGLTPARCWKVTRSCGPILVVGVAVNLSPSKRRW